MRKEGREGFYAVNPAKAEAASYEAMLLHIYYSLQVVMVEYKALL